MVFTIFKHIEKNKYIIYETTPKNMIYYIRDDNNKLIGCRQNEENYYYVKNAVEDIIGILNSNYERIVNYKYDAWGKIISITDNNGNEITDSNHIAHINPFRYRSYYYDEETELYYLNSRYYNPNWGRFINSDDILGDVKELDYNLYWYCNNNPINKIDQDGNLALELGIGVKETLGVIGAIVSIPLVKKAVNGTVQLVKGAVAGAAAMVQSIANAKSQKANEQKHTVYTLVDKDHVVQYVGRTVDPERRGKEHNRNPFRRDLKMAIDDENRDLPYQQARIKEEELIMKNRTLNRNNKMNNQRHGIRPGSYLYQFVNLGEVPFPDSLTYVGG